MGAATIASPTGVLELDTHSSSEDDPLESSPPLVSIAPMVSPFLCSDDLESDTEIPDRHVSPTTSTPEIPTAPILPAPLAIIAPSSEFPLALPGEKCKALTVRKHTPPDTINADSSTPLRFVHPPLARAPRCNEAYLRWRSVLLSTMYPPKTSHSLVGDSSLESSAGPSYKRCRSPAATVTSSIHSTRALVSSRADLLPPRKMFRDSISPEDSVKEDIDTDDEVESSDRGTMEVEVDMDAGIDIPDGMLMLDAMEKSEQDIETTQRWLGAGQLIASRERAGLTRSLERENLKVRALLSIERDRVNNLRCHMALSQEEFRQNMTITRFGMTPEVIKELVNRHVEEALAAYEEAHAANALEAENQSQNGSGDNGNGGNRNGKNRNGGNENGENGNGENGNGRNGNPNENSRGDRPVARECTHEDFMNALTWWNSHKRTIGTEAAFAMSWRELIKLMAEDIIQLANTLMDQKLKGYAVKNAENKRRLEVNQRDNRGQQPPFKRLNVGGQNVARAYTTDNNERKPYNGPLPLCNKCKLHHEGPCTVRCRKCNKVGHLTRDCKLKDQNHGNKAGNKNDVGEARGKAYVLGGGDTNPDSNVIKGTFLLNNYYAFVLFDSGADRSFMSTTFSTMLDITLDTLVVSYAVDLDDRRVFETNIVLKGCILGLLGHPFNIDLMLVFGLNDKLSSSDASFAKSKYKGNNRKKDIKSLTKSLDNLHAEVACLSADLNRATVLEAENGVQGELLSLATSAGFKCGLSMNQTENEFAAVLKKMTHFVPGVQAHSTNVLTSRDACVSPPISKESIVIPSSGTLELSANIVPAPSAIALEQNEEWVSVMVDGLDAEMTDVGSECVSFGPADVVVALSVGEKGDGSLPSSVAEEEATANLFVV
nr:hypothetical protein [Tanacetum cinerariifolium]